MPPGRGGQGQAGTRLGRGRPGMLGWMGIRMQMWVGMGVWKSSMIICMWRGKSAKKWRLIKGVYGIIYCYF